MDKIGLLYRVSSQSQETEGGGLELQQRLGKKISKQLGLPYVEFNEGVQSSYQVEINHRPVLVELLNEISKVNGIRKVWVFNTDRLGRYSQSWYSILKVFIDFQVEVYIGEDCKPYDLSNSVDKLTMGVLSLISQYDNELRRMRSILGKRNSLKSGNTWIGGTVPFGYQIKGKNLVINKEESSYVRKIFEMYNKGKSCMEIKVFLDLQMDIKPRRSGKGWNSGTVLSMLKKEIYIGKQVWEWKEKLPNDEIQVIESFVVKTPKIIDEQLFKEVQKRIKTQYPTHIDGKSKKSLLGGLLTCDKCKLKLGHRFKSTNHYYGKCSESNWRKVGDKVDTKSCPLKKSPRMEELDKKVVSVVKDVLLNSKTIREKFKVSNLNPKFEDEKNLKKLSDDLKRRIRDKNLELSKVDEELLKLEFDIRLGTITQNQGEKLRERFKSHLSTIQDEVNDLNENLQSISNSTGWVNWLNKINENLEEVETFSFEKQREFLLDTINKIDIKYDPKKKSHQLDIKFKLPIIGDSLNYTGVVDKNGFKEYQIKEGKSVIKSEMGLVTHKSTQTDSKKMKLIERIISLKEKEGLSLNEISDKLNNEKMFPPNGGKWYKSKLSSFYNYSKKTIPK
jgi:DNA invertase Pin-like site-specific DNA recombinase